MLKADLHIHSNISDGSNSIEELINISKDKGIDIIAITDHDTVSHLGYTCKIDGIKVITGVEISGWDPNTGKKVHIIGYNIEKPEIVQAITYPILKMRHETSLKQIDILRENGYKIDINSMTKSDGKYIYKQNIMQYLIDTNQAESMYGSFYRKTFKNGGICDFDIDYVDAIDAVKAIKKAGGKAVLAHSGQQKNFYLIDELVKVGLDGLEYGHIDHDEEDHRIIKEYADKYNLFLTGGSDYHGANNTKAVEIGDYLSPMSGIEALV